MASLKELDLQDKKGNIVISPDLKVRHKNSQYEYTVDSVIKDDQGQNVVLLRMPEEPRFDTEDLGPEPKVMKDLATSDVLYEIDPNTVIYEPEPEEEVTDEDLLAVPSKEFEEEYEVK